MEDEERPLLRSTVFVPSSAAALSPAGDPSSAFDNSIEARGAQHAQQSERNPLTGHLALLCFARMMDPVVFCSIFPYIAAMVQRNTSLAASDVGFYSGLVESLFAVAQTLALAPWARLADRLSHGTALACSLAGTAVGASLFGLATELWQMYLLRGLSGLFSASNLITRTMIAEGLPHESQPAAFGWLVFAANAGNLVGPVVGGALTDPARQYPGLFGGSFWLRANPYALPGLAVGAMSALAALTCFFLLRETQEAGEEDGPRSSMPTRELLKAPGVAITLGVYVQSKVLAVAVSAILPVYLYTPVGLGGLHLSPAQISIYMAVQGASQVFWLLVAFPVLNKRLGTQRLLSATAALFGPAFAGYIVMNAMLRSRTEAVHDWMWLAVAPAAVLLGSSVIMAQTSVQLAVNDASPSPATLSGINALALIGNGIVRAVTPGTSSAVFSTGVKGDILGGYLAWVVLILMSAVLCALVHWLPRRQDKPESAAYEGGAD